MKMSKWKRIPQSVAKGIIYDTFPIGNECGTNPKYSLQ